MAKLIQLGGHTKRPPKYGIKFTQVDDEDFEELNKYKWYAQRIPNTEKFYAARSVNTQKRLHKALMHNVIMETPTELVTDHKNGDPLNNQKYNLRVCTHTDNSANRHKASNNT